VFDIGFLELMVVGVLGLLVLGPERLPVAARTLGLFIGKIRRTMSNFQDDLERKVRTDELKEKLKDPYATFVDEEKNAATEENEKVDSEKVDSGKKVSADDIHSADKN
jgi:sec-independent protein translocase protein TatB